MTLNNFNSKMNISGDNEHGNILILYKTFIWYNTVVVHKLSCKTLYVYVKVVVHKFLCD